MHQNITEDLPNVIPTRKNFDIVNCSPQTESNGFKSGGRGGYLYFDPLRPGNGLTDLVHMTGRLKCIYFRPAPGGGKEAEFRNFQEFSIFSSELISNTLE